MNIVSLLPSATEIVYALGLEDQLVAVTHECDFPQAARKKPQITKSSINQSDQSATIDRLVSQKLDDTGSLYEIDMELLERLKPDLILTQQLCSVCAVSYDSVTEAVKRLSVPPMVLNLEPNSLEDIFENVIAVGKLAGRHERALELVQDLRKQIGTIEEHCGAAEYRPRVFCMEWMDPPFCGGHWIPELVQIAGGVDRLGRKGKPSVRVEWEEIFAYNPEAIVIMCCGFSLERTLREANDLWNVPGWQCLSAVQRRKVFAVDGSAYFSRPGPRIVRSAEILAAILHPDLISFEVPADSIASIPSQQTM